MVKKIVCAEMAGLYRVVLIFPDSKDLAAFVLYAKVAAEVQTSECSFVGNLTEEQIKTARTEFGAYVRVAQLLL